MIQPGPGEGAERFAHVAGYTDAEKATIDRILDAVNAGHLSESEAGQLLFDLPSNQKWMRVVQ